MARHAKKSRKRNPSYEESETLKELEKTDLAEIREAGTPRHEPPPARRFDRRRPSQRLDYESGVPEVPAAPRTLPPDPLENELPEPERLASAVDASEARNALIIVLAATSILWLLLSRRRV